MRVTQSKVEQGCGNEGPGLGLKGERADKLLKKTVTWTLLHTMDYTEDREY